MYQEEMIARMFGLGMFVLVSEKVLKESGRGDMAYIVTFGGFVGGLLMILPLIKSLMNSTFSSFRF